MPDLRPGVLATLAKVSTRLNSRGPSEVLSLGIARVREALWSDDRLVFLVTRTTQTRSPSTDPRAGSLRLRRATSGDGDRYARDIGTDSAKTFRSRLSDATRCYLVFDGPVIVHASWVTTAAAWVRELAHYFQPPAGEAYTYESFTREEVRGRGAYPYALTEMARELAADGVTRLWVGVEAGNAPSARAISKAGFEPAFEVAYRRRFGRVVVDEPTGTGAEACKGCLVRTIRK